MKTRVTPTPEATAPSWGGPIRVVLAGAVVLLLSLGWPFPEATGAYLAALLGVLLGVLLTLGRPKSFVRSALARAVTDAVLLGVLVAGTGGGSSPFFPLYLLAALQLAGIGYRSKLLLAAAVTVGGYLLAAATGATSAFVSPAVGVRAGLLALACAVAASLASKVRRGEEHALRLSSALAAQRGRAERAEDLIPLVGPALEASSLETTLRWAAEAAHAVAGGAYAHVASLSGYRHATVLEGEPDVCPSWWHPSIQRLVLWSCRERKTVRLEEEVHGIGGFMAVPVGASGDEGWGALVVGGKVFGAEEEGALTRLAEELTSVLGRPEEALGGLDDASGLPNRASLCRFLRRELARGRPRAVLAVGREEGAGHEADPLWRQALIEPVRGGLGDARGRVFFYEEGLLVVVTDASDEGSTLRVAQGIQRRSVGKGGGPDRREPPVAVGFALVEDGERDPGPLLGRALRALQEAHSRPEKVAGLRAGGATPAASPGHAARAQQVVHALMAAMEARDPYLRGHSLGVSRVVGLIGREMSLPEDQLDDLSLGALLHDIGKIDVPDAILHKPGPLTAEEYEAIKRHPVSGAEIVGPLEELGPAIPAIRHHHERFDGGGYPDGLRGHDIPLVARVVSVADAFDTMTRERHYGRRISVAAARQEILDKSGTQFDPQVVAAFLRATSSANGAKTAVRQAKPAG